MPVSKKPIIEISDEEEARIQAGIAADPDNPEWTEENFRNARPFADVFPHFAESIRRARGRPSVEHPKKQVTLRLDADVVESFRAGGRGWQSRMNAALRKVAGLGG
ncbi:MAG: BrnA antitoxin family protein [Rhizobiaceae bacterium]|nr:BrnA antitoxin family protein [Rhizobiaceae bacterium]